MGFNTVRILGFTPKYDSIQNRLMFFYDHLPYSSDTLFIEPSNPSDPGMQTVLSLYDKILELANATAHYPLKIIMVMRADIKKLDITEINLRSDFLATLAAHFSNSPNNNALLAYDLINEPGYTVQPGKTKQEACEIISTWYDIIKVNDPYHLVTIGNYGLSDVFGFDPSMLKVDFNSLHYYPDFKPYEDRTNPHIQELARKRTANKLYWFNQASIVPWMIGETGFAASGNPKPGSHGTLTDQKNYADFFLEATCNCGGSGFSWWVYQDATGNDGSDFWGLLERSQIPGPAAEKPAVSSFRNYIPQVTGQCPVDYSSTFDANKLYYNPYQHPPSINEIGRYVKDQDGDPIKDAAVLVWTAIGLDTITKYIVNGVERDTFYVKTRNDTYYTHTDVNGYFKAIPSPHYGFDPPQNYDPWIIAIRASAAGASVFYSGWNPVWTSIPDPIPLNKIKDNVMVSGETVSSGQIKHYKGRRSLTVSNTTIQSGGNARFTSQKSITLLPGFIANVGSHVSAYITPPNCDEFAFREQREGIMNTLNYKNYSTASKEIKILFETTILENFISVFPNPTNSTVTIQLHSSDKDASLNHIKLYDIFGRIILQEQISGNSHVLDVSTRPQGVYFIEAKDETKSYYQKIIIQ